MALTSESLKLGMQYLVWKGIINVTKKSGQVVIYKRIIPKMTTMRRTDDVTSALK